MDSTLDTVEVNDPELLRLIDRDAPVEQLCTGFRFSEGPIWNPREQCLYFSDMPNDIRRRWSPRDGVVEVRNPSNKCNGMTYDGAGNLYVCEHVTSSLVMETPAGERKVLATHWQGKELNSPNDVVVRSDGTVYFTDPTYGRMPVFGLERKQELDFQGVYRVAPRRRAALRGQRLQPAERAVPVARRADPLRQRHRRGRTSARSTSRPTDR